MQVITSSRLSVSGTLYSLDNIFFIPNVDVDPSKKLEWDQKSQRTPQVSCVSCGVRVREPWVLLGHNSTLKKLGDKQNAWQMAMAFFTDLVELRRLLQKSPGNVWINEVQQTMGWEIMVRVDDANALFMEGRTLLSVDGKRLYQNQFFQA